MFETTSKISKTVILTANAYNFIREENPTTLRL